MIKHIRNDEHEWRCIMAWRRREHPAWSQFTSGYLGVPASPSGYSASPEPVVSALPNAGRA